MSTASEIYEIDSDLDIIKNTLGVIGAIGDAAQPYLPLISTVTTIITEIFNIYKNVQYNKNICSSLMDQVTAAEAAIKTLERRKKLYEKKFRDINYYKTFLKFIDVMERIKQFIKDISTLSGFKRLMHVNLVKEKFGSLINEFETTMNDLHFATTLFNKEQREIDAMALKSDLEEMSKFLETIGDSVVDANKNINNVLKEVLIIKNHLRYQNSITKNIRATEIEPKKLNDPQIGNSTDTRGNEDSPLVKKLLNGAIEVACKRTKIIDDSTSESQRIQTQLAILGKLKDSPNILKFYGLSKVSNYQVMVFEWAELGTLQELYGGNDIACRSKVQIALDICRGLVFLHTCEILHHDIRCANILMTLRLEPKIANFKYARHDSSHTNKINCLNEIIPWMAPEKLKETPENPVRYTFKCEIFSFGMMLWELAFEKIPYANVEKNKIKEHVLKGNREKISWGVGSPDIQKIQRKFAKIIISDINVRTSLQDIFLKLNKLSMTFGKPGFSPSLLPDGTIDFDGSKPQPQPIELPEMAMNFNFPKIMLFEEGIKAHKKKDYKTAWECFQAHSELGNATAKYWMGYYLSEGYPSGVKDLVRANQLFKAAADDGIPDAQLHYAFSLTNMPGIKFNKKIFSEFSEYLMKAADARNVAAQYNLGDMYLNGQLLCPVNEELGVKYLKLAALNDHIDAIKLLEKKEINIFS
ncbi:6285_t:CDS:2 [Gigaspora margarita]|uniref:6285_t:CDS:1 n=1 Tax=Gigaspora margarita TaxID=4874 RepID=A0ABN7VW53_GIGMA|nr:6285_t:CDS:2 [Gigaspora margarita]